MKIQKQKLRMLGATGTLSALLIGAFVSLGGPSIVSAVRSAGELGPVTTVADVQVENEALREAVSSMQTNELLYQEQLNTANQVIGQLQADLTETAGSYEQVLTEYDESLAGLQSQNVELIGTLATLQQRDGAYTADLESANGLLTEKQTAIDLLQARESDYVTAIEQANGVIGLIQLELNNSQQAFVNLKFQYDELVNAVDILNARELEYQARINEFNNQVAAQSQSNSGGGYEGEEYEEEEYEEEEEEEYDDD